jgi:predicted TIM-barrel enzyme
MSTSTKRIPLDRRREEAVEQLRQLLPVGTTVFTILRSITRSRMKREIDVLFWDSTSKGSVIFSWLAALVLDCARGQGNAVVVRGTGTGMDMEYYLVSQIARVLHGRDDALVHGPL